MYGYTILCSVSGYELFPFGAVMNNAMNIHVYIFCVNMCFRFSFIYSIAYF